MITSVGAIMLNQALPPELQKDQHDLDKKGVHKLLQVIAEKHPDAYKNVVKTLNDVGREAAWTEGVSVSLSGLRTSKAKQVVMAELNKKLDVLREDDSLSDEQRSDAIVELLVPYSGKIADAVVEEAKQEGNNPFYLQVNSGARGKKTEMSSLRGADLLVENQHGKFVPIPITSSYAEGFKPSEYFAASYGQRKGMIGTKLAVADSGYGTKMLVNAAHRVVVTKDNPEPTRLPVGLPTDVSDKEIVGQVLAHDVGKHKAGTLVTRSVQNDLEDDDIDQVLVHSPMTELTPDGGISRLAAGKRHRTGLTRIGDNVGIASGHAIGEKWSQSTLNCLAAGTLVRMADFTTKPIEQVVVGDLVLGADTSAKVFPVRVTRTYDHGEQPCSTYSYRKWGSHGKTTQLTCTAEHKVLVRYCSSSSYGTVIQTRLMPIGSINKASGIISASGLIDDSSLAYDWRAKLLGVLLGDGCYTKSVHGMYLSCADYSQIEHLNEYLAPHALRFLLSAGQTIYYSLSGDFAGNGEIAGRDSLGRITKCATANPIIKWFDSLGINHKYAHEKVLPDVVLGWNNLAVAELLAGLYVTDGCVYLRGRDGLGISYASTSERLVDQVAELLSLRFGIYATKSVGKLTAGRNHKLVTLRITRHRDLVRFNEVIPLFGVKETRLANFIKTSVVAESSNEWSRYSSVDPVGLRHVYDIEVDHPDHLFVLASNFIVSNSKHSAGVKDRVNRSGVDYIFRLLGAPEHFPEAGPLAEADGHVEDVRKAEQGGHYVKVAGKDYYLNPGLNPTVKKGDVVESGDDLSDGVPHPHQLVKLRGMGEARRVYANALHEAFNESGVDASRRNVQAVVAGLMNWAKVTNPDGIGDNVVDDIAPFNRLAYNYKPRQNAKLVPPKQALGKYLDEPVLHYTPGTRVNSKVLANLQKFGIKDVHAHDEQPDFEPEHVRSVLSVYHDPDWQTRLAGFYTSSAFQKSVHRGAESDANSTSYFPALAKGVGFGKNLTTTGTYGP